MERSAEYDFLTRHSIKPKDLKQPQSVSGGDPESNEYPGISEKGVEKARERARTQILDLIKESDSNALIVIAAASEMTRTGSTDEVYGDELKKLSEKGESDMSVITRKEIGEIAKQEGGFSKTVEAVASKINNTEGRVIVDFPMFLKEYSGVKHGWFMDKTGKHTPLIKELLKRTNNDEIGCIKLWFESKGDLGEVKGIDPKLVVQDYLQGLRRLKDFAAKYVPNRQIIVGGSAHSWDLDALVTYLANHGDITPEGFEKACGGKMIEPTELIKIKTENGSQSVAYRGKEYPVGIETKTE